VSRAAALLTTLALLACGACRQSIELPASMRGVADKGAGEMDLRREYWDAGPKPQQLRSEVEGLVQRGGAFVKHGRERAFYVDGSPQFERHWVRGEPAGLWQSWWENGRLRSECSFDKQQAPRQMSFWHANGQLDGRGMAINGRRIGVWEFFHANGVLESKGEYVAGERGGTWSFWDEHGVLLQSGRFESGNKVGEWSYR